MRRLGTLLAASFPFIAACDPPPSAPQNAVPSASASVLSSAPSSSAASAPAPVCAEPPDLTKLPGEQPKGTWMTSATCLRYTELVVGTGAQPKSRLSTVRTHYTGWLPDGTKFDSSVDRGKPLDIRLSQVVKGWTEGLLGMKVGGKRKLVIPYELGYGDAGKGNIPPKATLIFDVELVDVLVE
jgi:peptidylprolyl isomerase